MKANTFYELRQDIDAVYVWSSRAKRESIRVSAGVYLCVSTEIKPNGEEVADLVLPGPCVRAIIVRTHRPTPIGEALVEMDEKARRTSWDRILAEEQIGDADEP